MASSFVDSIIQSMSSGLVSRLSTTLGEPTSNIETGLSTAIRAISASVATRANDPEAMGHIHSMALDPENDLSLPGRTEGMLSRLTSGSGGNTSWDFIQSLLLGNRMSNMSDSLASYAGVSSATAKSLFAMAMPLVMSYLGKMIRTDHLDTSGLSNRLAAERGSIIAGLPAALSKFYPSAGDMSATIPPRVAAASHVAASAQRTQRTALNWVLPAALAALAIWAVASFFPHSRAPEYARQDRLPRVTAPAPPAVGTSGIVKREMPGDVVFRFRPNGTESRLLAFVRTSGPVTTDNWFEFDQLDFNTGSAVLRSGSMEQISNVADILKAYPAASVKIGGYTDNTGDPAANKQLSKMRAEAVRDALERRGIDGSRLSAEGYGDEHPVADNNTAEGRAQNRRVAILVTSR